MSGEAMTTRDVAQELGVTVRFVQLLIHEGKLPAKRFGHAWVVDRDTLRRYKERKATNEQEVRQGD